MEECKKMSEIEYADWWSRFKAYFIDTLIVLGVGITLIICLWIVFFIFGLLQTPPPSLESTNNSNIFFETLGAILFILAYTLYFAYYESSRSQATPGKKYIGEYVCDISGKRISFGRALVRSFVRFFMVCFPLPYITIPITLMFIHFTKKNQGLHDLVSGTIVVKGLR